MSDTPIYDRAIDYSKKHAVRDLYRFNQLLPTQTAAIVLGQNSPDVYFELPAVPMNHAKSYLEFDFNVPASAAPAAFVEVAGVAAANQTASQDIATLGMPQLLACHNSRGFHYILVAVCNWQKFKTAADIWQLFCHTQPVVITYLTPTLPDSQLASLW